MKQSLLVFLALATLSIAAPTAKYHRDIPLDSYGRRNASPDYYCKGDCSEMDIPGFEDEFSDIFDKQRQISGERGGRGFGDYSSDDLSSALSQQLSDNGVAVNKDFADTLGNVLQTLLEDVGYLVDDVLKFLEQALRDLGVIVDDLLSGLESLLGGLLKHKRGLLNIGAGVNVGNLVNIGADIGLGKDGLSVDAKANILGIKAGADVGIGRQVNVDHGLGIPGVEDVDDQSGEGDFDVQKLVETTSQSNVFVAVFGDKSGDVADKMCHSIVDRCEKDNVENSPTVVVELLLNALGQILASIKHGKNVEVNIEILIAEAFKLVGGSLHFEDSFVESLVSDVKSVLSSLQVEVKIDLSSVIDLVLGTVDSVVDLKGGVVHGLIGGDSHVPEISVDVFVNVLIKNLLNLDVFVSLFGGDYDLCSNYADSIAHDVAKFLDEKDYHLNQGLAAAIAVQIKTVIVKGGFESKDVSEVVIVVIQKALTAVHISHDIVDSCTSDLKGAFSKYSPSGHGSMPSKQHGGYSSGYEAPSSYSGHQGGEYESSKHGSGYVTSYSGEHESGHKSSYGEHGSGYETSPSYSGEHGSGYESSPSYSGEKGGKGGYGSEGSSYSSPQGYKN